MVKLGYSRRAAATPAFALIIEGFNELVQSGLTPEGRADLGALPTTEVLYAARDDGELVGVLCWDRCDAASQWSVALGYVEPTSRKQGVYHELWAALIERARHEGVARIIGSVHPDNQPMRAVMEKLGRHLASLTYEALL